MGNKQDPFIPTKPFLAQLLKAPLLSPQKEHSLATAWKEQGDERSLHSLVLPYARLVVSIAMRFRHYGIAISDLIQEGNVGLMYAATRFDPERNVRFSTYSRWWIRATIQDFVLRNWSIVRTGSTIHQRQLFFSLRRLRRKLGRLDNESFSAEDRQKIATELNVPLKDIEFMENRLLSADLSLSAPTYEDSAQEWADLLIDQRGTPEMHSSSQENARLLQHYLTKAMKSLTPREQFIIIARRLKEPSKKLEELGKTLKVSRERVRQIEINSIHKLRYNLTKLMSDPRDFLLDE